ncbi:3-deoxy-D-manno-octulosonic acid transferase [soil metagenome]
MYFLYSILLTIAFVVLLPKFVFDAVINGKYAAGFGQRLGFVPEFDSRGRPVVWIHCVSVGETNAARPLVQRIHEEYPDFAIVVSTTTLTGQQLAHSVFAEIADLVFYFPFDWKSTVRRALTRIHPALVLLTETEIWFNFIRETSRSHARIAIVNGRLSERSFARFSYIPRFMHRVLSYIDLALMRENADAKRIMSLGLRGSKVRVTGNIKFDHQVAKAESELTEDLRRRFDITPDAPLIVAASTHSPEEVWILDAFRKVWKSSQEHLPRLMIVPRHPERFGEVANLLKKTGFSWVRRSENPSGRDKTAEVILLDSIGELRSAYPLAEIVFVGGSMVPHGGQSIYEPAASGRAIITGPYTTNFEAAVSEFLQRAALIQIDRVNGVDAAEKLAAELSDLLFDKEKRQRMGAQALAAMNENSGAVSKTMEHLSHYFEEMIQRAN